MIAAALLVWACAASESMPVAGILNDRETAELVFEVEAVLERNPAILALHRAYLAERRSVPEAGPGEVDTDRLLLDLLAQRLATTRSLFADDVETPGDAGAFQSAAELGAARVLAQDRRLAEAGGADAMTERALSLLAPEGRLQSTTAEESLFTLPPVTFESARTGTVRRRESVEPVLRRMVNAHSGLRGRYDRYLDVLDRYPGIARAAEAYWQRLVAVQSVGAAEKGAGGASVRRPVVPESSRPARPRVRRP